MPQTVTLDTGDADLTVSEHFMNVLKNFSVTVTKQDAETGAAQGEGALAGAVYGMYLDGELIDAYTTDENGAFTTKYYVCGDGWTVREITASEGYLLDDTVYPVGAEAKNYTLENNSISMTVREQIVKGYIEIVKVSADGTTGIETPENGAEFDVFLKAAGSYANADESVRDHLICDENGHAVTKALPYGIYTVHQTSGWESTEWVADFDVQVTENEKKYFFVINDAVKTAQLRVVKKDAESGEIIAAAGAGFMIWSDAQNGFVSQTVNAIDTFYADETGTLMLPQPLAYGSYSLHEVQAPIGYALHTEPIPFSVDGTEPVIEIVCSDMLQKGKIAVQKTGEIFSHVTEIGPAIMQGSDGTVRTAGNTVYYPEYAEHGLAGAKFAVIAAEDIVTADGTVHAHACDVVAEIVTDENGYAETGLLYLGKYSVQEIAAPEGYVLNPAPKVVELTYAGQDVLVRDTMQSEFVNERQKVQITLSKFMEEDEMFGVTGDYSSVEFGLFAAEEITAADGSAIPADGLLDSVCVDEDHTAVFSADIPFGRYYVQEIATDENYVQNGEKYLVNFEYAGQENAVVHIDCGQFENHLKRGSVHGKKTDPNGTALAGAMFGLFRSEETNFTADTAILTTMTDKNGAFAFESIPLGDYIVCEIAPPTGYIVSDEKYPVTVSEDAQTVEITIENKPISVNIRKQDLYGNELAGAEMRVVTADGFPVDAWTSDGSSHTISALPAGSYVLIENAAPTGYLVTTEIAFTVHPNGSVTVDVIEVSRDNQGNPTVIMKDDATKATISKQALTGDAELSDAVMQVIDKDGNVIEEWVSGDKPHDIIALLNAGETYTIHEAAAPNGYLVATDIVFTVAQDGSITVDGIAVDAQSEDGIPMIVMKDDATKVTISKRGLVTSAELPGATLSRDNFSKTPARAPGCKLKRRGRRNDSGRQSRPLCGVSARNTQGSQSRRNRTVRGRGCKFSDRVPKKHGVRRISWGLKANKNLRCGFIRRRSAKLNRNIAGIIVSQKANLLRRQFAFILAI